MNIAYFVQINKKKQQQKISENILVNFQSFHNLHLIEFKIMRTEITKLSLKFTHNILPYETALAKTNVLLQTNTMPSRAIFGFNFT